jgi:hypothetical protein
MAAKKNRPRDPKTGRYLTKRQIAARSAARKAKGAKRDKRAPKPKRSRKAKASAKAAAPRKSAGKSAAAKKAARTRKRNQKILDAAKAAKQEKAKSSRAANKAQRGLNASAAAKTSTGSVATGVAAAFGIPQRSGFLGLPIAPLGSGGTQEWLEKAPLATQASAQHFEVSEAQKAAGLSNAKALEESMAKAARTVIRDSGEISTKEWLQRGRYS